MNKQVIKNRIEAVNKLHAWINATVPAVIMHIENNPYKVNKDKTGLFKKDNDMLQTFLADTPFRAYFKYSEYSGLSLHADIYYTVKEIPDGGQTVNYFSEMVYLENLNMAEPKQFTPFTIHNVEHVLREACKLDGLKREKDKIESAIRDIVFLTGEA